MKLPANMVSFEKRDNMGFSIAPALIVLIILLASFLLVILGYATHRLLGLGPEHNSYRARTVEQDDYMREVRNRNLRGIMGEGRRSRKEPVYDSR
jgi:hypothetical protein